MPAIETAFAVIAAAYLTLLTVAMAYFAFVVSERQDLAFGEAELQPADA